MNTKPPAGSIAAIRMTRLFGKFWNQIVKIVTREVLRLRTGDGMDRGGPRSRRC